MKVKRNIEIRNYEIEKISLAYCAAAEAHRKLVEFRSSMIFPIKFL